MRKVKSKLQVRGQLSRTMVTQSAFNARRPQLGRKLQAVWDLMLARSKKDHGFTAAELAKEADANVRMVRGYCRVLRANGYLTRISGKGIASDPARFIVGSYRDATAPQIAGGSGGGAGLGRGWKPLQEPAGAPLRVRQMGAGPMGKHSRWRH